MESIVTEYEPPKRFNEYLEPLPVVPERVRRRRAESRAKGRTLRLIEKHGFEMVRQQFNADVAAVDERMQDLARHTSGWGDDMLLDCRKQVSARIARIYHQLHELAVAAEVLKEAKQATEAA